MQAERIVRYVVLGGIFLIPFIPFLIANSLFFPFITGKNFAFRIIVELIFAAWVYLALADPKYRPRFSWILASFSAFAAIIALADIFSVNPYKSFWSNFERMDGYVTLLHLFAYFIVASATLSSEKFWERLLNTSIGASVLVAGYGYLQLFGVIAITQSSVRISSTLGNASYLAVYMIFHMFLAGLLFARRFENVPLRYLYGAIIFLEGVVLYHTATRGAILGFLGGVFVTALLVILFERKQKVFRKGALWCIALMLLVSGGLFALRGSSFIAQSPVLSRFSEISLGESGVNARFVIWNMAWQGVKERPLLGWGQESFNYVFNKNYDPRLYAQEQWFDRVHNIVFDWLIAGGFLGLLGYLSLFLSALWYLWFYRRAEPAFTVLEKALLTGLLAAYFFQNLFVFDNITSYLLFATVLAYITTRSVGWREPLWAGWKFDEGVLNRIAAPVLLIATLFILYFFNGPGLLTARTLIQALSKQENVEKNIQFFKQAIAYDSFGTQEVREQIMVTALGALSVNIDPSIKQEFSILALSELEKQAQERSGDARAKLFLANFLTQIGQHDAAIALLEKTIPLTPRKQQLYLAIANAYLGKGDYAGSLGPLSKAFALEPASNDARIAYATGALYAGDGALAKKLLMERFGTDIVSDDRLIQVYTRTKQFTKAVAIWQMRITEEPKNSQYRVSLAATYLEAGRRADAVSELRQAISLNPSFKQQGEYYINEIQAGRNP